MNYKTFTYGIVKSANIIVDETNYSIVQYIYDKKNIVHTLDKNNDNKEIRVVLFLCNISKEYFLTKKNNTIPFVDKTLTIIFPDE